ncbi:MAG: homocysteine S-methyltransferase family protein [Anaerolineae bacterium]|nr:homocysteine S-methyltransferase family protein [Anaerolineae bacterium]
MIILDGAMGTELTRRGIDTHLPLWSAKALMDAPNVVAQIHADYVAAGAQVLTANTFRTNVRALGKANLAHRARELTFTAVALAQQAASAGNGVRVAGSLAPVEDCYSPDLVPSEAELDAEHGELARNLADAGCNFILVETMNTVREAVAGCKAALATGLPFWVSFTLDAQNNLISGERIAEAVQAVLPLRPQAVLVNCVPVAQIADALTKLRAGLGNTALPFGGYGNVGHVDDEVGWTLTHAVSPVAYAEAAHGWRELGASIIGGCCGTLPAHIAALAGRFGSDS